MITTEQNDLPVMMIEHHHQHRDKLKAGLLSGRILLICSGCSRVEKWYPMPEEYDGLLRLQGHWASGVDRERRKREDGIR